MTFCSIAQEQQNVILQDVWTDTNITLAVEDARYSDIWGFEHEGQNYCVVGSSEGVEILRVGTNSLERVCRAPASFQGYTVVHRDMKTHKGHLYFVGDEGTASLQIFDLSYLPDSLHEVYNSDTIFGKCHNIFVDSFTERLYCAGTDAPGGMIILDISDPANPKDPYPWPVGYVHDLYVRNDTAYLNMGPDGLNIVDFSGTPVYLGAINFYPNQGYNHSGWLSPSGDRYVFADETQGTKLKLCLVNDLSVIQIDEQFGTADYVDYMPHNVIITDQLAFVAYYNEGFRIFDLTSFPIQEVGAYDTFTEETNYKLNGAWGVYVFENSNQIVISDRQNGVFLFSFPIDVYEEASGTVITNTPFIDENSYLLPRDRFDDQPLRFSVFDLSGQLVYDQENYLNWMNIPLVLNAGVYYYAIYDQNGEQVESGKFAKAN